MSFKRELALLGQAIKQTKFGGLTKKKILKELLINGIALLITFGAGMVVHTAVSSYVRPKTRKDELREKFHVEELREKSKLARKIFKEQKDKREVMEEEEINKMEGWISGVVTFIVGLFVFTFVEGVMERYFEARDSGNFRV